MTTERAALTSEQRSVLRIFGGLHADAGRMVPVTTLLLNWRMSGPTLADALESLAAAGLLTGNQKQTGFALTAAGAAMADNRTAGPAG